MINVRSNQEIEHEVLRAVEQALKGVPAEIAIVDEDITEIDLLSYISFNAKQQRVAVGRIEKNTRELKNEIATLNEHLEHFLVMFAKASGNDYNETRPDKRVKELRGVPRGN